MKKPNPTTRRAVLAGGAALAVGAPALAATAAEDEPDAPMLRDCLACLDAHFEADRRGYELDAVLDALGDAGGRDHPDVVQAWRLVDEACDRASDHINRLTDAEATTIVGVFAKVAAVALFDLDAEESEVRGAGEVLPDLVRLVRPSAGPLVHEILAHPALADVLGDEPATA